MTPLQIVGLLLAIALAGDAALGWAYLGARDKRVEATGERDQARSAAMECSVATQDLITRSDKLAADVKVAQAAALKLAQGHEERAQQILSAPASTPGNDCQSAGDRARAWLQLRGKAKP